MAGGVPVADNAAVGDAVSAGVWLGVSADEPLAVTALLPVPVTAGVSVGLLAGVGEVVTNGEPVGVGLCVALAVPVVVRVEVTALEGVLEAVAVGVPVISATQKDTPPSASALTAPTLRTLALRTCVPEELSTMLSYAHCGEVWPEGSTPATLYSCDV